MKIKHNLYAARNPQELKKMMEQQGIDIVEIVRSRMQPHTDFAIMAIGSLTTGYGTPESDLDIMVLMDTKRNFARVATDINFENAHSFEVVFYKEGIEINIHFMARDELNNIIESFLAMAPALYNPADMKSFFLLEQNDLQFLDRLKNGWILFHEEQAKIWQDEFMSDLLPVYSAVKNFFDSLAFLEDANSALHNNQHPQVIFYMGTKSMEHGLAALFAASGYTSQAKKWMFAWAQALQEHPVHATLQEGLALLFPPLEEPASYLKNIASFHKSLQKELSQNASIKKALDYLTQKINYLGVD